MSTEIVTKKRGRPKKSTQQEGAIDGGAQFLESGSRKKNGSARKVDLPTSKESKPSAEKKATRKNKSASTPNVVTSVEAEPSSTVGIIDQANAFANIKQSVEAFSNGNGLTREQLLQTDEVIDNVTEKPFDSVEGSDSQRVPSQNTSNFDSKGADSHTLLAHSAQPSTETQIEQSIPLSQTRSQFLSAFLDDAKHKTPPVAPENAKFSDRSATKAETPSIEDIIRGPGVTALIDQNTSAKIKSSHTGSKEKPVKSFEQLTISKFPVISQAVVRNSISPSTYRDASFSAFKQSPSLQSQARNTIPTKARPSSEKFPTLPTQPASAVKAPAGPVSRPVRPTELSYEELSKQPKYQQLKWKYTVLMVGVPVILVTSWALWKRLAAEQSERRHQKSIAPSRLGIDRANNNVTSNGGV